MNNSYENMEHMLSDFLHKNSTASETTIAIISDNVQITYRELSEKILKVISTLESLKLPKNICIGLRFDDPIHHLLFILALFKMGIKQTSIYPGDVGKPAKNKIDEIGIDVIIQNIKLNNIIKKETIYINENLDTKNNIFDDFNVQNTLANDTAIVLLGSGTTGTPKLIELSSPVYAVQVKNDTVNCNYSVKDRFYCFTNLYYQFALRRTIIALLKGVTILLPKIRPTNIINFCIENSIDHLMLTGDQSLSFLIPNINKNKKDIQLPGLKSCVLSSTMIKEPLRRTILAYVTKNLFVSYGTNELGNISEATPDDIMKHPGTVGKINPHVDLKIVDDNGNRCEISRSGKILVKTSKMINGYSNNKKATEQSFTKENGYYPGDIGKLTSDGHLIIEGRSDDMMIFAGVNVYPRELESILETHPNVIESAVFPLSINYHDGIPFAVVVVNQPVTEKALLDFCQTEAGWLRPQRIFFTKKLPKNDAGKILKRELAKQAIQVLSTNNLEK